MCRHVGLQRVEISPTGIAPMVVMARKNGAKLIVVRSPQDKRS